MKETITAALAIPFVIVSTWFGVQSVNNHFDHQSKVSDQIIREDERNKNWEFMQCVRETYLKLTPEQREEVNRSGIDICKK